MSVRTRIIDQNGRIGFGFRVFNGNRVAVSILATGRQLTYADHLIPDKYITVELPPKGIQAAEHRELCIFIELRGPVSEEIKADIGQGKLKPIGLEGLHLLVKDIRGRTEKVLMPRLRYKLPTAQEPEAASKREGWLRRSGSFGRRPAGASFPGVGCSTHVNWRRSRGRCRIRPRDGRVADR